MDRQIRTCLQWLKLFQELRNAGIVCRRCGISRPTLGKWVRRHEEAGIDGLKGKSKRPKHSPLRKVTKRHERWILELRKKRKLGVRRIQNELKRLHECSF